MYRCDVIRELIIDTVTSLLTLWRQKERFVNLIEAVSSCDAVTPYVPLRRHLWHCEILSDVIIDTVRQSVALKSRHVLLE